jgi:L-rhamnose isomerase
MNRSSAFEYARERYAEYGVDVDAALARLSSIPISVNCWQGDDNGGFEGSTEVTGGILVTGNHPGRARTAEELRADFEVAHSLVPGSHRFNLHAKYLENGGQPVDRDAVELEHFRGWIEWARSIGVALDFNPTFYSHDLSADGFTLTSKDDSVRRFWIEHGKRSRNIAAGIGRELGTVCLNNLWIPDGWKDLPADRLAPRRTLIESLDEIYAQEIPDRYMIDAVESKLFGIGSESYVVGSHEFYLAYALTRDVMLTMDAGHYHPTESIAEKISALLVFLPRLMLHVSRPVRWDSDHVVLFDDETRAIMREIARADAWDHVYLALDFFDASINRVAAWVIGVRNTLKAVLFALLEPIEMVRAAERDGRLADRLALQEEAKSLPFGIVWDHYCEQSSVPAGTDWMPEIDRYEREVLLRRH